MMRQSTNLDARFLAREDGRPAACARSDLRPEHRRRAPVTRRCARAHREPVAPAGVVPWRLIECCSASTTRTGTTSPTSTSTSAFASSRYPPPGHDRMLAEPEARSVSRLLWALCLIGGIAGDDSAVLTKLHHVCQGGRCVGRQRLVVQPRQAGTADRTGFRPCRAGDDVTAAVSATRSSAGNRGGDGGRGHHRRSPGPPDRRATLNRAARITARVARRLVRRIGDETACRRSGARAVV